MKKWIQINVLTWLVGMGLWAQSPNPIVLGNARFTVITPQLIRMEYATNAKFVDQPTLFASNRNVLCSDFKWTKNGNKNTISTSNMELEYINDGLPFSQMNIRIKVFHPNGDYDWRIYSEDDKNLGGTLVTLDGLDGEVKTDDGLLSRNGWHIIEDSRKEILQDNWLANRPTEHLRDMYFFGYGLDYKSALKSLTAVSGEVPLNRKYVHGVWYCRWWNYTDDDYRDIVKGYKDHDFPLDVMVMDMAWHTQKEAKAGLGHAGNFGWTGYTWNEEMVKNPKKLLDDLHKDNLFVTLNDHPADGIRTHEKYYPDFMKAMGYDANSKTNLMFQAGDRKYMENFFKYALEPNEKMGVDFWWLDWQQDYVLPNVLGFSNQKHIPWLNKLYFDHSQNNNQRGLLFSRWGGWGSHRTPIQFSGDASASWEMLKFQVPFTATSSNAGCFFWAHDIGGFYGDRDPEKYVRWTQFGLTNSSLRVHSVSDENLDRRPWLWGKQAEDAMRIVYHWRAKLMPYIYSSVWKSHNESTPLNRAMYIDYNKDEEAYQNPQQFLFGDYLLSAPIVSPGKGEKFVGKQKVWFPKDASWYNIFDNKKYNPNTTTEVEADIYSFPLFLKGGCPLVTQPYTQRPATAVLNHLNILVYPGNLDQKNTFELYEDDGVSNDFQKGFFAKTNISYTQKSNGATINIDATTGNGYKNQPKQRSYTIELPLTKIKTVMLGNKKLAFRQNPKTNSYSIEIPKTSITKNIQLDINY